MDVILTASDISGFVALVLPDKSGDMVRAQAVVTITQYNMIVKYDLKGYADQAALKAEQQTLMNASIEDINLDIVLNFKKILVEEGGNEIIVDSPQNFIYELAETVGGGHVSNKDKNVTNFILGGNSKVSDTNQDE